ncbi:uncharacterized protein LOC132453773 [Gadus macrocephalus]|uniref:uncharacterized protein LOC132453773 n=1 Tax=Gadus macrocephalus TaxID=80720 RepID=UPI0028CBB282|nr:uncharacterized protein LOC132453773 [Gadus macrocephalus]
MYYILAPLTMRVFVFKTGQIIWSGRNQEGAGTTAGEEVEMVNSYLSRCGLTTKYMTKSARNDMLTIHAIGWYKRKQDGLHLALSCRYVKTLQKAEAASQKLRDLCSDLDCPEDMVHQWVEDVRQWAKADAVGSGSDDQHQLQKSIEEIFLGVHQKKANLYNQTDGNKIRHLRRRKLWTEKKKLFEKIRLYNQQVPEEERIVEEKVEGKLSLLGGNDEEDSLIWPWEMHSSGISNIAKKKRIFDACMAKMRVQEEKVILVREMRNHCAYLNQLAGSIRKMTTEMSSGESRGNVSEEGHRGLICLLRKRLLDLEEKLQAVSARYRQALGPDANSLLQDVPEEDIQEQHDDLYESTDDSD